MVGFPETGVRPPEPVCSCGDPSCTGAGFSPLLDAVMLPIMRGSLNRHLAGLGDEDARFEFLFRVEYLYLAKRPVEVAELAARAARQVRLAMPEADRLRLTRRLAARIIATPALAAESRAAADRDYAETVKSATTVETLLQTTTEVRLLPDVYVFGLLRRWALQTEAARPHLPRIEAVLATASADDRLLIAELTGLPVLPEQNS